MDDNFPIKHVHIIPRPPPPNIQYKTSFYLSPKFLHAQAQPTCTYRLIRIIRIRCNSKSVEKIIITKKSVRQFDIFDMLCKYLKFGSMITRTIRYNFISDALYTKLYFIVLELHVSITLISMKPTILSNFYKIFV